MKAGDSIRNQIVLFRKQMTHSIFASRGGLTTACSQLALRAFSPACFGSQFVWLASLFSLGIIKETKKRATALLMTIMNTDSMLDCV